MAGLKRVVRDALIDQDAMAFMALHDFPVAFSVFFPWRFVPPAERVPLFAAWFATELYSQVVRPVTEQFAAPTVENVVRSGMNRGYDDTIRSRRMLRLPSVVVTDSISEAEPSFTLGGKTQYLATLMNSPRTVEEIRLFRQRVSSDLDGIMAAVKAQVFRAVMDTVEKKGSGTSLYGAIVDIVDTVMVKRLHLLINNETVRWYSTGQLLAMEGMGVRKVKTLPEQKGNGTSCSSCTQFGTMALSHAWGQLPLHIGCVCVWLPAG